MSANHSMTGVGLKKQHMTLGLIYSMRDRICDVNKMMLVSHFTAILRQNDASASSYNTLP